MTQKLEVARNHIRSQLVRRVNEPGDSELPFGTKLNGVSGIRTFYFSQWRTLNPLDHLGQTPNSCFLYVTSTFREVYIFRV